MHGAITHELHAFDLSSSFRHWALRAEAPATAGPVVSCTVYLHRARFLWIGSSARILKRAARRYELMPEPFRPSAYANLDELTYRDRVQRHQDTPAGLLRKIRTSGRLALLPYLRRHRIVEPCGDVLEIGAGSGWLSAELSKIDAVDTITTLDFSEWLVSTVMPEIFKSLEADTSKIECRRGDFHNLSPLGAGRYDWVFADSALHHASNVTVVLREVAAVLKSGGALVAVREPVAPMFSWSVRQRRAATERALKEHGVEEPLYTRSEWQRFFDDAGLQLQWHDVSLSNGLRRILAKAVNGITKADYCLVGRKVSG